MRGFDHHEAQDILHDFLSNLLRLGSLNGTTEEKGRLRGFLFKALHIFLINWQRDRSRHEMDVSMHEPGLLAKAEERYLREQLSDKDTPDLLFARKWVQDLLTRVLLRLWDDYRAQSKDELFNVLKPALFNGGSLRDEGVITLTTSLGMNQVAVRKALERMLEDYRVILVKEVGQTLGDESEIDGEITALYQVFHQPV